VFDRITGLDIQEAMKPTARYFKINDLADRMQECKTEQEALQIAADWVLAFKENSSSARSYSVAKLMDKFGDALESALAQASK
jgi:alpha-ketoglutarate-dependent taurine dioxygenase